MCAILLAVFAAVPAPLFERHLIDRLPGGYQVAVADVNGDGRPDVIALSTDTSRVEWYENPSWTRHTLATLQRPIDLACRDVDGDGRPEIALAAGFYFNQSDRGGELWLLKSKRDPRQAWGALPIGRDPVTHRVRWADVRGDGRPALIHAPIFGPGSHGATAPKPAHLWAFVPPKESRSASWNVWKIDETLTVLHGLWVGDLDSDGRDEILTASYEGIFRFDWEPGPAGSGSAAGEAAGRWAKSRLAEGAPPAGAAPGASRGSSEVCVGRMAPNRLFIAAIEPWHGNQVVVYTPGSPRQTWNRHVLDTTLEQGHALVAADFDGDGQDELVAGWRGGQRGLRLYDPADPEFRHFQTIDLDQGIAVEGVAVADLNADGRLDLVAIAGRTSELVWYENRAQAAKPAARR